MPGVMHVNTVLHMYDEQSLEWELEQSADCPVKTSDLISAQGNQSIHCFDVYFVHSIYVKCVECIAIVLFLTVECTTDS